MFNRSKPSSRRSLLTGGVANSDDDDNKVANRLSIQDGDDDNSSSSSSNIEVEPEPETEYAEYIDYDQDRIEERERRFKNRQGSQSNITPIFTRSNTSSQFRSAMSSGSGNTAPIFTRAASLSHSASSSSSSSSSAQSGGRFFTPGYLKTNGEDQDHLNGIDDEEKSELSLLDRLNAPSPPPSSLSSSYKQNEPLSPRSEAKLANSQIDLDELEASESSSGEQGPLLKDYQSSMSTIRKDYTTVDWYFTKHNLGRIRRMIRLTNKAKGWKGKAMNAFIAAQGWIILLFVGFCTALSACFIHLVTEWLSDIREGYCSSHSFFITRRVCCIDAVANCGWKSWTAETNGDNSVNSTSGYWLDYTMYVALAIPMAVSASWFVEVYAHSAARSGLSEIKTVLGGFIIKRFLGIRTVVIKSLGLILAVSSGLHVGKLGPLVHIACCWGNIFSRKFAKYNASEVKKREILSASVAAGVSAAFGSPIGGVLFSLESVSSYFPPQTMWRSFWCSVVSVVVLQYIDPFQTGKLVQFAVQSNANQWNWVELPLFAIIGGLGGFIGSFFTYLNLKVNLYRKQSSWLRLHPVKEVLGLIFLTALINYPLVYLRGSQSALLAQLFTNCRDVNVNDAFDVSLTDNVQKALCGDTHAGNVIFFLFLAVIIKFLLTTITYGCNVPSGVFMPGLIMGALIGRIVGNIMEYQYSNVESGGLFSTCAGKTYCVSPGLYAIIGAAAVLAGITRLTVSLTIIIFEVTGGLEYIVPIMISIVCAKWCADAFGRQGLYAQRISKLHGYPWIDAFAEMELIGPAMDIMSKSPVTLTVYGHTLHSLKQLCKDYPYHGFPIIDNVNDQLIYGYIARSDLELVMDSNKEEETRNPFIPCHFSHDPPPYPTPNFLDFSPQVDKYPIKVLPHTPIDRVLGLFQGLGLRYVLVQGHKGALMGIIKKKDLLLYIREHKGDGTSLV